MCGRVDCNMPVDVLCKACAYKSNNGSQYVKPFWLDIPNAGYTYTPSTNIGTNEMAPVVVDGKVFGIDHRVMMPMFWNYTPTWYRGDLRKSNTRNINAKKENVMNSNLYADSVAKGYRCVVFCKGFYEWLKIGRRGKQPYYIYAQQPPKMLAEELDHWLQGKFDEKTGWKGPRILKLAGIYSIWEDADGQEVYTFAVVTMDSDEKLKWIHNRMPAILSNERCVKDWLESGRVPMNSALELLKPTEIKLAYHPVSTMVNSQRNKGLNCNKPLRSVQCTLDRWIKGNLCVGAMKTIESDVDKDTKDTTSDAARNEAIPQPTDPIVVDVTIKVNPQEHLVATVGTVTTQQSTELIGTPAETHEQSATPKVAATTESPQVSTATCTIGKCSLESADLDSITTRPGKRLKLLSQINIPKIHQRKHNLWVTVFGSVGTSSSVIDTGVGEGVARSIDSDVTSASVDSNSTKNDTDNVEAKAQESGQEEGSAEL